MNLKDSVILAMRQSRQDKQERVVGKENDQWVIRLMSDRASDLLTDSIIITSKGFKYPDDETRFYTLKANGE